MSATGSIFNWLFASGNANTQSAAEQQAAIANLQNQLGNQTTQRIDNGTLDPNSAEAAQNYSLASDTNAYIDPGEAAAQTFFSSIGSGGDSSTNGPGIGSVLTDVLVIGAIAAGIWAFFEFGGTGLLKSLAAKSKWWVLGIVGAVALLAWLVYSMFQKTASDTSSTLSGIEAGLNALNPFGSSTSSDSSS